MDLGIKAWNLHGTNRVHYLAKRLDMAFFFGKVANWISWDLSRALM